MPFLRINKRNRGTWNKPYQFVRLSQKNTFQSTHSSSSRRPLPFSQSLDLVHYLRLSHHSISHSKCENYGLKRKSNNNDYLRRWFGGKKEQCRIVFFKCLPSFRILLAVSENTVPRVFRPSEKLGFSSSSSRLRFAPFILNNLRFWAVLWRSNEHLLEVL